ncbi:MAG: aminotransferase class V-fold PLP-dependent enzyme [Cyanobacteria bacterium RI_101]|nr:aminotransferase class V-fold PLP-dependent enzyme [Cyanobacteria bacterium RI_101]
MQRPLYFDYQATTPLDPAVFAAMTPYFTEAFGNAGSQHFYGWEADAAIKQARQSIAAGLETEPEAIIFTSGATESNNLAIKGVAEAYFAQGKHIITVQTEHRAVLDPCRYLETLGFEATYLPVQANGLIDLAQLESAFRPDTILVSVMAVNNEIGAVQPLEAIGRLCRERGVLFHCDGAQALGKIPLPLDALNIDLLSFTAHKLYGPKGIGALYIRPGAPAVRLAPQIQGGGQERGLRSGTLFVPQIVGFAKALELALAELESEKERLTQLRNQLWSAAEKLGDVYLNGDLEERVPGNLNFSVGGVKGPSLLLALQPHLAVSSGSACSAHNPQPSHVLTALGRAPDLAKASVRVGIGRFTAPAEVQRAGDIIAETIIQLRYGD